MLVSIIWILVVVIIEFIAPKWLAVVLALANIFIPDSVPVIDEVLQILVLIQKFKEG